MSKFAEQLKQGADQAWESLSEGWRELSSRASGALTKFIPSADSDRQVEIADRLPQSRTVSQDRAPDGGLFPLGAWSFMASDVFDSGDKVVVRIEAPGMRREDFHVELNGNTVVVWGEKRSDREVSRGSYSLLQCAYGSFWREVALPVPVEPDKTTASYRDGVLRIELLKAAGARARRIEVKEA